nr:OmpH family outer membrane protein [Pontibacter harenae]
MAAFAAACTNDQQPDATLSSNNSAATDSLAVNNNIVYVNSDSLLANYEYFKQVRTRLQGRSEQAEKDLRAKAQAFEKEVTRYQQSAQNMTMEQRASTEQRLAQKQQQLQAQNQEAGNSLVSEESEEMKKIYDKVEAYLQQLSKERGYKMVLTYTRGNSAILYGDSTLDITTDVVQGLNQQYQADQEETATTTKKK